MANESKRPDTSDEGTRELIEKKEQAAKVLSFIQWAAALVCLMQAAGRFSNDTKGMIAGFMLLAAAWVVSPMVTGMKLLRKIPFAAKIVLQIVLAAALFAGGYFISLGSEGNIDSGEPAAQSEIISE